MTYPCWIIGDITPENYAVIEYFGKLKNNKAKSARAQAVSGVKMMRIMKYMVQFIAKIPNKIAPLKGTDSKIMSIA